MARGLRLSIAVLSALALLSGAIATAGRTPVGEIAFSVRHGDGDAPSDIYVVRTDGRWISRKTTPGLQESDPVWSPDGRHIAFVGWIGFGSVKTWVYTMSPDGTHRRRLAPGGAPQWSPDGGRIAYVGDAGGIFVMDSNGSGRRRLTRDGGAAYSPHWSPDGKHVAFTSAGRFTYDVHVANSDGSGERRLTRTRDSFVAAWAPGRRIIFTRTSVDGIYIVDADGTGLRKMPPWAREVGGWSPDGQLIVYAAHGISTVRPRDGVVRRLTRRPPKVDGDPAWSPDGRVIAFARRYTPRGRADGIWIVNRDGSGLRRIAVAPLVGRLRWNDYYTPTWAPR